MTTAIQSLQNGTSGYKAADFAPPLQKRAAEAPPLLNYRALFNNPWAIAEGTLWAGFAGLSASIFVTSLSNLQRTLTLDHSVQENLQKIGSAVLKAFTDLMSLTSSIAYLARWADEAKVIGLGRYLPLVKNLCIGTSLVINLVETGADLQSVWVEKEAIQKPGSLQEKEKHRQLLCHALIKLVGNVNMIAWAVLGIASLAGGLVVSPVWMTMTLGAGCLFGITAFFYKMHLDRQHSGLVRV